MSNNSKMDATITIGGIIGLTLTALAINKDLLNGFVEGAAGGMAITGTCALIGVFIDKIIIPLFKTTSKVIKKTNRKLNDWADKQ